MDTDGKYLMIPNDSSRMMKVIVAAVLSLLLSVSVFLNFGYLQFLDSVFASAIQKDQSHIIQSFYKFISFLVSPGMDIFWVLVIAFLLWGFKYKIPALWAILTIISGDVFCFIVKNVVRRDRPPLHLAKDSGFSYPSGHVFGIFMVIVILWLLVMPLVRKRAMKYTYETIMVVVLVLVMFARIYLNAHFPTDTLGSVLFGFTWMYICEWLYGVFAPRLKQVTFLSNSKI